LKVEKIGENEFIIEGENIEALKIKNKDQANFL
jgi:hypothetical protein